LLGGIGLRATARGLISEYKGRRKSPKEHKTFNYICKAKKVPGRSKQEGKRPAFVGAQKKTKLNLRGHQG